MRELHDIARLYGQEAAVAYADERAKFLRDYKDDPPTRKAIEGNGSLTLTLYEVHLRERTPWGRPPLRGLARRALVETALAAHHVASVNRATK